MSALRVSLALLTAPAPTTAWPQEITLEGAEVAFAQRLAESGLRAAVDGAAASDLVLLYAGAPVVVGRDRAHAWLAVQPILDTLALTLEPSDRWVSADGDFGVTQGFLVRRPVVATARGTYIAAWRRADGAWQLVGLTLNGIVPPDRTVLVPGDPTELPPEQPSGAAGPMVRADREFSALAGRQGAAEAFRAFAAPDAIILGVQGSQRGPDAIAAAIAKGAPADWAWVPVAARASARGDLGFTVGQAVIRPRSGEQPILSKYLTAWRRQPDGTVRFLTDGGNPRPRP